MRNPLPAALAPTAEAQEAGTAAELDTITVYGRPLDRIPGETATKSGAPALETPFSVNIVPRELLDLRNVSNIGQAVETVSGVERTIGFSGNQRFRIRGFQAISTLPDGFRQGVSQPEIDLQGVESIEVLKGPASALYGRFEPGGVINFVSKRPEEAFAAGTPLTAGADDYARLGVDLTGPLNASGSLGRANLAHEDAGSFRERQKDSTLQVEFYGNVSTGPLQHRLLIGAERNIDRLAFLDGDRLQQSHRSPRSGAKRPAGQLPGHRQQPLRIRDQRPLTCRTRSAGTAGASCWAGARSGPTPCRSTPAASIPRSPAAIRRSRHARD